MPRYEFTLDLPHTDRNAADMAASDALEAISDCIRETHGIEHYDVLYVEVPAND